MVVDEEDVKTFNIDCEFLDNLYHMEAECNLTDEQIVQQLAVDEQGEDEDYHTTKARELLQHVGRLEASAENMLRVDFGKRWKRELDETIV